MDIGGSVSVLSIVCMAVSVVLAIVLPALAVVFVAVKNRLNGKALLAGVILFAVFALVLEKILHYLVLGSNPTQSFIYKTPVLFMLYGGLAAGVFEETARLIGFKFFIKVKEDESINTGISYGLGHGGIEAVLLGGMAAVNNIIYAVLINTGDIETTLKSIPESQVGVVKNVINSLISTPSHMFLISGIERVMALVIQVSLSLIVLKAVKEKKWVFFVIAVLAHAVIDFPAALYQAGALKSIYAVELIIMVLTALCALAAFKISSLKVNKVSLN